MTDRVTRFVRSIVWSMLDCSFQQSTHTPLITQTSKSKALIIKCRYKKTASVHKTSTIQKKPQYCTHLKKTNMLLSLCHLNHFQLMFSQCYINRCFKEFNPGTAGVFENCWCKKSSRHICVVMNYIISTDLGQISTLMQKKKSDFY